MGAYQRPVVYAVFPAQSSGQKYMKYQTFIYSIIIILYNNSITDILHSPNYIALVCYKPTK